jgi:LPXTG-motif cell wall-anchored protein
VDVGGVEITADKDHTVNWSPFIGIGIMVIGGGGFFIRKKEIIQTECKLKCSTQKTSIL